MKGFYNLYSYDSIFSVLISLRSGDKFNRKWTNQALVQYCWWVRALLLRIFLSKFLLSHSLNQVLALKSETSSNHRILGWKGPQGSPGPAFFGKSTLMTRWASTQLGKCVQHWKIQHFPGIFQGLVVLTGKSAPYRASTIAVVEFCTSAVLFHTEPGCFLLPSRACRTALCISAQLQLQSWRAGQGKKARQIHSSAFLSS